MTDLPDLTPATERLARLVTSVSDAELDRPTPCDYDVATLLTHLHGLARAFTLAAQKSHDDVLAAPPAPRASDLPDDWRTAIPTVLGELAAAWRDEDAWTGFTKVGGMDLPGEVTGMVALNETTIHGWDLAAATGQAFEIDDRTLALVEHMAEETSRPENAGLREGMYGDPVPVPEDAGRFDRVLALDGRSPAWPR